MKKIRMTIYLEPDVHAHLADYAARRRQPLSIMVEAAVAAFVDPESREAQITRRLSRMDRQLEKLSRDTNISVEAFFVFIWLWLSANPANPEPDAATRASVTERYDRYMDALGQRLAKGGKGSDRLTQAEDL
jgi:predicted transcriptional regulator